MLPWRLSIAMDCRSKPAWCRQRYRNEKSHGQLVGHLLVRAGASAWDACGAKHPSRVAESGNSTSRQLKLQPQLCANILADAADQKLVMRVHHAPYWQRYRIGERPLSSEAASARAGEGLQRRLPLLSGAAHRET